MIVHGSCHCGNIKFEADVNPEKVSVCHCTDCQTSTGSAFRVNVPVSGKTFRMISGTPTIYVKTTADSGNPRAQAFCSTCGSPLYSTTAGDGPQPWYMVRVGILNERRELPPKIQNWRRSAQPWLTDMASVPKNEKAAT